MKIIVVRDGSVMLYSEFGQEQVRVGDVGHCCVRGDRLQAARLAPCELAALVPVQYRGPPSPASGFFERAIGTSKITPVEVVTDHAPVYPGVLEELAPAAWHRTDQYANNRVECDHGRLKARLWPMRGLKQDRSAKVIIAGHAFVQNLRRGRCELAVDEPAGDGRVRRTRRGDLKPGWVGPSACRRLTQRNSATPVTRPTSPSCCACTDP